MSPRPVCFQSNDGHLPLWLALVAGYCTDTCKMEEEDDDEEDSHRGDSFIEGCCPYMLQPDVGGGEQASTWVESANFWCLSHYTLNLKPVIMKWAYQWEKEVNPFIGVWRWLRLDYQCCIISPANRLVSGVCPLQCMYCLILWLSITVSFTSTASEEEPRVASQLQMSALTNATAGRLGKSTLSILSSLYHACGSSCQHFITPSSRQVIARFEFRINFLSFSLSYTVISDCGWCFSCDVNKGWCSHLCLGVW